VSRSPRTRRTGVAAIGVVIGALALAGCGAGQITQTNTQVSAVSGAQATVGAIAIRDAEFEYTATASASVYPTGGNAPIAMTVVNSAGTDDKLVSATSPVARSVRVTGTTVVPAGRVLLVEGVPAAAPRVPASTGRPTASPAPTTAAAATDGAQIVLVGVNQEIRPGLTYPVTLTFQKAGTVTVDVPVGNPTTPRTESAPE
jgi:copper(I)-binding protein